MAQYVTKDGRRISIFSPITRQELSRIPEAHSKQDLVGDSAYRDLQTLVMHAFAKASSDYILGFVSGFNSATDRVREMAQEDVMPEQLWRHLMLLLSEAAHYLPADDADDESAYLKLPAPGSQDN